MFPALTVGARINETVTVSFTGQALDDVKKQEVAAQKVEEAKPPGWDEEDVYLEKVCKNREEGKVFVHRIDANKVRYKCKKCGFQFAYNVTTNWPSICQYCERPVDKNFYIE